MRRMNHETIVEVNVRDETVAEQLQFWRSVASRMERSKLGISSGLIEIVNTIKKTRDNGTHNKQEAK